MSGSVKENVTRRDIWLRLVFMMVLGVAFYVAEFIIFIVVVFQFLSSLFTSRPNHRLKRFGRNLARYLQQITIYWAFATEDKPFPFAPWPDEPHDEAAVDEESKQLSEASTNTGDVAGTDNTGDAEKSVDTEAADDTQSVDMPKD